MNVLILAVEFVGFMAFLYIALRLLYMYLRFNVLEIFLSTVSFFFLSISQLCALLSIIYSDIKVSTALYVATATTAIVAFFIMIIQRHSNRGLLYTFITFSSLLLMAPDAIAGILSTYIALYANGCTKTLLAILSISYYLRAVSVMVSIELSPIVLLIAELIRCISAVTLAVYSSIKVFKS
ncbi:MAG: hypothetical protein QXM55_02685 [Ignisphaera sp.]